MISSGYFLALTVGGWILVATWRGTGCSSSRRCLLAVMFVVDYVLVKDQPSQAGFPDFDTGDATSKDADKDKPVDFGYLVRRVFTNPVILTIIAAEFCTGFVRQGVMLWFVPFLKEVHHIDHGATLFSVASTGITVGGILGGLLCGYLSDHVFQSRRPPVAFIFYIGQIVALLLLGHDTSPVDGGVPDPVHVHVDLRRARHAVGDLGDGLRRHQGRGHRDRASATACSTSRRA